MQVDIGDKISAHSIQANNVTGNVTAILGSRARRGNLYR